MTTSPVADISSSRQLDQDQTGMMAGTLAFIVSRQQVLLGRQYLLAGKEMPPGKLLPYLRI